MRRHDRPQTFFGGNVMHNGERSVSGSGNTFLNHGREKHVHDGTVAPKHSILDVITEAHTEQLGNDLRYGVFSRRVVEKIRPQTPDNFVSCVSQYCEPHIADMNQPSVGIYGLKHHWRSLPQVPIWEIHILDCFYHDASSCLLECYFLEPNSSCLEQTLLN